MKYLLQISCPGIIKQNILQLFCIFITILFKNHTLSPYKIKKIPNKKIPIKIITPLIIPLIKIFKALKDELCIILYSFLGYIFHSTNIVFPICLHSLKIKGEMSFAVQYLCESGRTLIMLYETAIRKKNFKE